MNKFIEKFNEFSVLPAIIWNNISISYKELIERYDLAVEFLKKQGVLKGEVVALTGDFSPNAIAILFALIENNNIIVPFNYNFKDAELLKPGIAGVQKIITVDINTDAYKILFTQSFENVRIPD